MKVVVLPGDGIGPEVVREALKVLDALQIPNLRVEEASLGSTAYSKYGNILPSFTIKAIEDCDAVLLGAVGMNRASDLNNIHPERSLLKLRKMMNCFINLREVKQFIPTKSEHPTTKFLDFNLLIIRELISGIYFGTPRGVRRLYFNDKSFCAEGFSTSKYSNVEIESIARIAFEISLGRKNKVLLVDKANVLETSKVWRRVTNYVSQSYRSVELRTSYIDSASIEIIARPEAYDVVLTENLFGDILSDQLSSLAGSIGMLPSASLGLGMKGLYEPVHGSAPLLAGKDLANPIGTILSLSMLLKYSLNLRKQSSIVERAVSEVLKRGCRTIDISGSNNFISTSELGAEIVQQVKEIVNFED